MQDSFASKIAVVTGGTDGIGKEIARGLAGRVGEVLIVGKNVTKGEAAASEIRLATGNDRVRFLAADLSSVGQTELLVKRIHQHASLLDYLVLCAGVIRAQRILTTDGIEEQFATNYLSRFHLTLRLLPNLWAAGRERAPARILLVGGAAQKGKIHFEDINLTYNFGLLRAIGQFCQANDVFTVELSRRLAAIAPSPG